MDTIFLAAAVAAIPFVLALGYNLAKIRSTCKSVAELTGKIDALKEIVAVQSRTIDVLCERLGNEKERLTDVRSMLRRLATALEAATRGQPAPRVNRPSKPAGE